MIKIFARFFQSENKGIDLAIFLQKNETHRIVEQ